MLKGILGGNKKPVTQAGILDKSHLKKMNVITGGTDIHVFIHDKPFIDIVLDTFEDGPQLNVRHDGDTAVIETIGGSGPWFFSFNQPSHCLQIKVPLNVAETWYIKSGSGDVEIPKMLTNAFHLSTGSGDVALYDLKAQEAKLHATSGDMNIHDVVTDTLEMETTSGDAKLGSVKANSVSGASTSGEIQMMVVYSEKLTVKVTSGDVSINDVQAETIDLVCTSGNIEAENIKAEKAFLRSSSGDIDYSFSGDCSIHGIVTSGDMSINCKSKEPNATIDLHTRSGDIHTNLRESIHKRSGRHLTGVVGKGDHQIRLESSSGDVALLFR